MAGTSLLDRMRQRLTPGRRERFAVKPVDISLGTTSLHPHRQAWQDEAWDHYRDNVGEFAAVTNWRASAISRANLYVAEIPDDPDADPEPLEDDTLTGILEQLGTGGRAGYGTLLKRMSIHLDVPGETILVGTADEHGRQYWFPVSQDQITTGSGGLAIQVDNLGIPDRDYIPITPHPEAIDQPRTVLRRIYEPDPKYPWLAISPARHARKALRILHRLTDRVNADTLSRLTNGILLVNGNVQLPSLPDRSDLHADPQMAALIYAGMTAIENPESPAAALPILGRVTGEDISKTIQKIDLGTSFDEQTVPLFELFLRRLALMLDVPPEVLLGVTEANHWTAAIVSDDAVRIHLTPTLELIADALTRAYLRPAIRALNQQGAKYDPSKLIVWFDTSRVSQRPNRTDTALALYQQGVISEETLRKEASYGDPDAPTLAERRARLLTQLALAGKSFVDVEPYLRALGIELDAIDGVIGPVVSGTPAPADGRTTPSNTPDPAVPSSRSGPEGPPPPPRVGR